MKRKTDNLWTDLDALARLARAGQSAERASKGASPVLCADPEGRFPHFPDRREFDIDCAGSAAHGVTGDLHDFFFVSDDVLAFLIADVCGKGVPAAVLTSVTRSMVRDISSVAESPGETLTRVNEILRNAELGAMYLTIFLAWYDTRSGDLRYSNAGHPAPYRVRDDGEVKPLGEATGSILGILNVERYAERADRLDPGDRLVLYTDGVTEARGDDGEMLGHERLAQLLKQHRSERVDRYCDSIVDAVRRFGGTQRDDDATLLALMRRRATPGSST
ncbi:MAG: serine/threonine-protein phosphatase [bacterium]|nr:serine/threonine-protein phosphatase [bacterium]